MSLLIPFFPSPCCSNTTEYVLNHNNSQCCSNASECTSTHLMLITFQLTLSNPGVTCWGRFLWWEDTPSLTNPKIRCAYSAIMRRHLLPIFTKNDLCTQTNGVTRFSNLGMKMTPLCGTVVSIKEIITFWMGMSCHNRSLREFSLVKKDFSFWEGLWQSVWNNQNCDALHKQQNYFRHTFWDEGCLFIWYPCPQDHTRENLLIPFR